MVYYLNADDDSGANVLMEEVSCTLQTTLVLAKKKKKVLKGFMDQGKSHDSLYFLRDVFRSNRCHRAKVCSHTVCCISTTK